MADVYCPKCGEPCDTYEFHDVANELATTYDDVTRRFRVEGCDALPGWRCNPDRDAVRAQIAREVYSVSGDDMDGAAADLEHCRSDVNPFTSPPTPTPTDPINEAVIVLDSRTAHNLARALMAAHEATTRDPHRDALQSVLVEMDAEHWTLVATDSYVMARVTMPRPHADGTNPPVGAWQIHRDHAKQWAKLLGARTTNYATLTLTDTSLTVAVNNADQTTTTTRPVTQFPNYRTVWPDLDTMDHTDRWATEPVGWNPEKLAQMAKSWRHLTRDGTTTTQRTHPTKPNVWTGTIDNIRWEWLAMPLRIR